MQDITRKEWAADQESEKPQVLDANDPNAEGLYIGEELHAETCFLSAVRDRECQGCQGY